MEVWVSGLNHRFAKPANPSKGSTGSNPVASAFSKAKLKSVF